MYYCFTCGEYTDEIITKTNGYGYIVCICSECGSDDVVEE